MMKLSTYTENAFKLLNEGKIDEEVFNAMLDQADEFTEPDEESESENENKENPLKTIKKAISEAFDNSDCPLEFETALSTIYIQQQIFDWDSFKNLVQKIIGYTF